jgi:hypothetical protein
MLLHQIDLYSATGTLFIALGALVFARYIIRAVASPLRDLPGPPLARFTRLWELYYNWQGQLEHVMIDLHKHYGMLSCPNTYKAQSSA